jgi:hypothetical protein
MAYLKYFSFLIVFFSLGVFAQEQVNNTTAYQQHSNHSEEETEELEQKLTTINKARLIGCIRLARSRFHHEQDSVNKLIEAAGTDKVISTLLINCYSKVSIDQATEFVNKEDHKDIDALTADNRQLLEVEKWTEIYKKADKDTIYAEMEKMKEASESFFAIQDILKKESDEEDKRNGINKEDQQAKNEEYIPVDKNKRAEITILGFNISEMNPFVKNLIGFVFIFLIFGGLYFGLKKITAPKEAKKKKNKKNN